jgi:peptidoglycan L-alanyl-D-glutamate endopeptidase CwlK
VSAKTAAGAPASAPIRDPLRLAPRFRAAVAAAIEECNKRDLDAYVYETYRSAELQALYYERGRTVFPPDTPVTNASSNLYSWHGFGLAVDVISRKHDWNRPYEWFAAVADCFREQGCRWGGEWKKPDLPHFQWGLCKPSPSDQARTILATSGLAEVWRVVHADDPGPVQP